MVKVARSRWYRAVSFLTVFSVVLTGTYHFWEPEVAKATTETFTSAGSSTWLAPLGVSSVTVECWGAGGGGGAGNANTTGGGGGGGAYAVRTIGVTGGNFYSYTVGAGGTLGAAAGGDGGAGGDSTFTGDSSVQCVADGGGGGAGNAGTAGTAGLASNSTGDTTRNGGAGGAGTTGADTNGGGGGGSAGTGAAGNAGTSGAGGGAGGSAVTDGGAGGNGGTSNGKGDAGNGPGGGGGGGAERSGGPDEDGGVGAAGQIRLTYTVDGDPPTPNPPYFVTPPAPDSSSQISMISTTTTDVSGPVTYNFTETTGDCGSDHGSGGTTSGYGTSTSYTDTGLSPNKCYAYTIISRDNGFITGTSSTASSTYTHAATPGGPTYSSAGVTSLTFSNTENGNPASNPTTRFYIRASSTDASWNNVFIATTTATSATPVWLTDAELDNTTLTGLQTGTLYEFESVARNENGIVTATSTRTGTSTVPDTFAPTPVSFSAVPNDVSNSVIDMTANTATDDTPPVEYQFNFTACGANGGTGGTSSGWGTTTNYTDTGLQTNKCYGYTLQTRDNVSPTPNTSSPTAVFEAYTTANTPGTPSVGSITGTTSVITINSNGNPDNTEFTVRFASSDGNWNGRFLAADGTASTSEVWMSSSTIGAITVNGLQELTNYTIDVKARNGDNEETSYSSTVVFQTLDQTAPTPNPAEFTIAPTSTSNAVVTMTAATATDSGVGGVEYQFVYNPTGCGADNGGNGATRTWDAQIFYTNTGLSTNKCYAYTVQYRDTATSSNYGATSTQFTVYTNANTPATPTIDSVGTSTLDITINPNGNPTNTVFAVRFASADSNWNGRFLAADGTASTSEVWMSTSTINAIVVIGLDDYVGYDIDVKARSGDLEETSYSSVTSTTTLDATAPTPSPATFDTPPTNTGTSSINMVATTASDSGIGGVQYQFLYNVGTCGANAGSNGSNLTWQGSATYEDTNLDANKCYGYTVQYRDASLNTGTVSSVSQTYTSAAIPGQPSGTAITDYTFQIVNDENGNPTSNPVTEFAVYFTSSDSNWNQRYLNTDGTPTTTRIWMSDSAIQGITVTGVLPSTTYTAGVVARNFDGDVTATSTTGNITTATDATPPTPNPVGFATPPSNDSATQISMITNAATDDTGPVEYFFTAVTGSCGADLGVGGTNSSWQQTLSYSDSGLEANQCYAYTITARDAAGNAGATSTASSTYTSALVPGQVSQVTQGDTFLVINNDENGNPTADPETKFAVVINATSDGTWLNQYVDGSGNPSASAVWLTDAQLDGITVNGLQPSTSYTFAVKAQNIDGDETAFGSNQVLTTRSEIIQKNVIRGGVRLQGTRLY